MAGVRTDARSGVHSGQKGGTTSPWPVGAGTGFHTTERRDGRGPHRRKVGGPLWPDTVARAQLLAASAGAHRKSERVRGHHRRKVWAPTRAQ